MTSSVRILPSSAPRGPRGLWRAMVEQAIVPEAELDEGASRVVPVRVPPAEIRALAFLASLGPASPPVGGAVVDQVDLAGEEAFLGYLARIAPSSAA